MTQTTPNNSETLRQIAIKATGLGIVREGNLSGARLEELAAGMAEADASPTTLVAHCRMHQLIATKRESKG
jgi:hypothetical protein